MLYVDITDIGIYSHLAPSRGRVAAPAQRTVCILLRSLETAPNHCKLIQHLFFTRQCLLIVSVFLPGECPDCRYCN